MSTDGTPYKPVTIGIIGLGRAGWMLHLETAAADERFRPVAVVDPLEERVEEAEKQFGVKGYTQLGEMLASDEMELVVVASPSQCHFADARAVLDSGRHCLVEKPMAGNILEAEELLQLAREKGRRLFLNHTMVYSPVMRQIRQVVERGVLGPLFQLRAYYGGYLRRWDWQTLRKYDGGVLPNKGSHVLSMMLPLMGGSAVVRGATLCRVKDAGDAEDFAEMMLQSPSGISGNIVVTSASAYDCPQWLILGKYGSFVHDGTTSRLKWYDPALVPLPEAIDGAAPGRQYQREDLPWQEEVLELESYPLMQSVYEDIHGALRAESEPLVSAESGLEVIRCMDRARELGERTPSC